ncbi:hypothetical protein GALL_535070 [mine drainage metagenome]|uniref:Uncharacterized protein n=1 Tax=mine drainage metagenome TaxID=410659 RepID=A0A1J5PMZ4_9ZZZZ
MPTGAAIAIPISVIMTEPKIALARPPFDPGGGVIWVKIATLIAPRPFHNSVPRIAASQNSPKMAAAVHSTMATRLVA